LLVLGMRRSLALRWRIRPQWTRRLLGGRRLFARHLHLVRPGDGVAGDDGMSAMGAAPVEIHGTVDVEAVQQGAGEVTGELDVRVAGVVVDADPVTLDEDLDRGHV